MPELISRLHTKDKLRSAFFEISAAAFCKRLGYIVVQGPGIQKKGLDFDFVIEDGSAKVNVEVTELRAEAFDVPRAIGSLDNKRKQLPRDAPAILICYLPFSWRDDDASFRSDLDQLADGFFRNSRRINALCFSMEQFVPGTRSVSVYYATFLNGGARHPSSRLDEALHGYYAALSAVPTHGDTTSGPIYEFKQWVDSLIP